MKKFLIILGLTLFLVSCFKIDNNNSDINEKKTTISSNIVESNNNENENVSSSGGIVFEENIPEDYKIYQGDLSSFIKMLDNDKSYFKKNKEELLYFFIRRDYLFDDNYTDGSFNACLNGITENTSLNELESEICDGKNIFIENDDGDGGYNPFHIKDTLIKLKKVKEGTAFDCKYFVDFNYKNSLKNNVDIKINDYFSCKKLQKEDYSLLKYHYNFYKVLGTYEDEQKNYCNILDDTNLIKLCNEKIKEHSL